VEQAEEAEQAEQAEQAEEGEPRELTFAAEAQFPLAPPDGRS